jgi:type I restriction enzyme M protein
MAKKAAKSAKTDTSANLGFEAKLWLAADKLRNNMDAAEYKHVVLGLIFLKYISDTFEEHRVRLVAGEGDFAGANPEDKDEYLAANVFWVPKEARWAHLQSQAKQPGIGKDVDDAMVALERDNPRLKGALNKNYGRADLDKHRLGELIDLIGSIQLADVAGRSKDLLGRVFEYFLTQFASAEGKNGGQFYTPSCVVRLLVDWWKCWRLTKAAFMTRPVVPAGCLCSPRSLWNRMAASWATSAFTVRRAIRRRGVWRS